MSASEAHGGRFNLASFVFGSLQLHKQADMQEEKNRIERVLGAISQPELIQKVLSFALSVSNWINI